MDCDNVPGSPNIVVTRPRSCLFAIIPLRTKAAVGFPMFYETHRRPSFSTHTIEQAINILAFEHITLCDSITDSQCRRIISMHIIIIYYTCNTRILYDLIRSNFNYLPIFVYLSYFNFFFRLYDSVGITKESYYCCTSDRHRGVGIYCNINNTIHIYYTHTYIIIIHNKQ